MSEPTSILAFRNGSIGNTLAAAPALRALRTRFPNAQLHVVVDSLGRELLEQCPWINSLIVYDKSGRDRGLGGYLRVLRESRAVKPSHAVLFKRFLRNGLLAFLSGARVRVGFRTHGKAPFLNVTAPYEDAVSVVDLDLRLAALLGAESTNRDLELFLSPADRTQAAEIATRNLAGDRSYVVAHYGGLTTSPDFIPVPRFVEMLNAVTPLDCLTFLIGHGPRESQTAGEISRAFGRAVPACNLPIRVQAALVEGANFFLGFNSGPAHIAAAVHTPSLILFRPDPNVESEIRKWCPPSKLSQPLVPPTDEAKWPAFLRNASDLSQQLRRESATIKSGTVN